MTAQDIAAVFERSARFFEKLSRDAGLQQSVVHAADLCVEALKNGNKILVCGNGGSAADAQHIAAELVVRFKKERRGLPAIALTVNSSVLTAAANDYSYDEVFARQVEALGRRGDVLLAISTSGNSESIVRAARKGRMEGVQVIALTGENGGRLAETCDLLLAIPERDTPLIQEAHITIAHLLCDDIEKRRAEAQ